MSKSKLLALFLGILSLFFLSEILYLYKNPDKISVYSLILGKTFAEKNIDSSMKFLMAGAQIPIQINFSKFPRNNEKINYEVSLPQDNSYREDFKKYMLSLPSVRIDGGDSRYDLSRVFYDLSILSINHGYLDLFKQFLIIAVNLDPELSYWPVELANYYYSIGEESRWLNIINICTQVSYPSQHCTIYKDNYLNKTPALRPGFLMTEVNEYYRFPSTISLPSDNVTNE